jgi:hypothetical protein
MSQAKVILFSLLFSVMAQATVYVWPLGLGFRFEREESQGLKAQSTFRLAAGFEADEWNFEVQRDQFESKTSEGNTSVKREYEDFSGWVGYSLYTENDLKMIGRAGLGFYQERVKTQVAGFQDEGATNQEFFSGVGVELRWVPFQNALVLSGGGHFLYSQTYDPELQPDLFLRLGFLF